MIRQFTVAAFLLFLAVASARAQGPNGPLSQAVRSYQNLDYETAADLLRRTVSRSSTLTDDQRVQAWTYLGASEFYLGRRDAAANSFRQLLSADVRARPDPLVFPPEIQAVFEETRRSLRLVQADVPRDTELRVGQSAFEFRVYTSAYQDIAIGLAPGPGAVVRWIYNGPISDSLDLSWDGRDAGGQPFNDGSYVLRVMTRASAGRAPSTVEIPLRVSRIVQDMMALPRAPAASQYLPERTRIGMMKRAATGLLVGLAVLALPAVAGADSALAGAPVLVGGAIGIVGIADLALHPGGKLIPANVAYNRKVNDAWKNRVDSVTAENNRRAGDVRLVIRSGEPVRDGGDK